MPVGLKRSGLQKVLTSVRKPNVLSVFFFFNVLTVHFSFLVLKVYFPSPAFFFFPMVSPYGIIPYTELVWLTRDALVPG